MRTGGGVAGNGQHGWCAPGAAGRVIVAEVIDPIAEQVAGLRDSTDLAAGRLFYDGGPGRTIEALAAAIECLAARGMLQLQDPRLAAEHFNWLVMSIPLNRVMLCGDAELPVQADLDRYADAGARVFLAAYGAN